MENGPIVNVQWCLAEYLRYGVTGTKKTRYVCGGQFVAKLTDHFQLFMGGQLAACTKVNPPMGLGIDSLVGLGLITRDVIGGLRWVAPINPTNIAPIEEEEEEEEEAAESNEGLEVMELV